MNVRLITLLLPLILVAGISLPINPPSAFADPCGMVPPIYTGGGVPIVRKGLQQTYVFYKDGVETFAIRPGYEGKVEDFGMLIPFPTPPSVRKVPDNIFSQLANAIDPPEVVIDLRPIDKFLSRSQNGAAPTDTPLRLFKSKKESVRVIRKEAVGMYEVAVLAAGSAEGLKKWMDENGYVYPKGMDEVTSDYIEQKWCFVAVKTKVAEKQRVSPKPGQRKVDSKLPKGAIFDGQVQGMAFRFKSDELVVPMRLSAFNGGDLRNVVYLLSDGPRRIRNIPEEFVQRQISGKQLIKNITKPLPLRIIGGAYKDLSKAQIASLKMRRNPTPHNGLAKELFAFDLLAAKTEKLSMQHEVTEKELLRVSEYLGLRDKSLDAMNANAVNEEKSDLIDKALADLESMTLTVVDGDFPRKVIAEANLKFEAFEMAKSKNTDLKYDAKTKGPRNPPAGKLYSQNTNGIQTLLLSLLSFSLIALVAAGAFVVYRKTH